MGKSRKKIPIGGFCGSGSEKLDKKIGNRRLRKKVNQMIQQGNYDDVFPIMDEVINKYDMAKDGKGWFGDMKGDPKWPDEKYYDKFMRK